MARQQQRGHTEILVVGARQMSAVGARLGERVAVVVDGDGLAIGIGEADDEACEPSGPGALDDPRVHVTNADAFVWLEQNSEFFDFAVVDFPDPTNHSLGKLYTSAFYRLLDKRLSANGLAVIQSTSPMFARQSYWCIVKTVQSVGLHATPYHVYVPSFGEWGFVLASKQPFVQPVQYPQGLRFLSSDTAHSLFQFPKDMQPVETEVNRLNNQALVHYYEAEWQKVTP
jgi:spermidine synthase